MRAGARRYPGLFLFCQWGKVIGRAFSVYAASCFYDERGVDKEDGVKCPRMQHECLQRVMLTEADGSTDVADAERRLG